MAPAVAYNPAASNPIRIRAECPRCSELYQVGVPVPGIYQTHCPGCEAWIPVIPRKEKPVGFHQSN
jgi:hypothetical protein